MFKVDSRASSAGTGYRGNISAKYVDLVSLFGEPEEDDGYKVSGRWVFTNDDGDVFTVYDMKQTSLYSPSYQSVRKFRSSVRPQMFHVGGKLKADSFINWIERRLSYGKSQGIPVSTR